MKQGIVAVLITIFAALLVLVTVNTWKRSKSSSRAHQEHTQLHEAMSGAASAVHPSFKTLIIKYKFSNVVKASSGKELVSAAGDETKYIDVAHQRVLTESHESSSLAPDQPLRSIARLIDGDKEYFIDFDKKTITADERPKTASGSEPWTEENLAAHGQPVESKTIAGKECQVFSDQQITQCIWEGLILKEERHYGPSSQVKEAVEVAQDVPLPSLEVASFNFPITQR